MFKINKNFLKHQQAVLIAFLCLLVATISWLAPLFGLLVFVILSAQLVSRETKLGIITSVFYSVLSLATILGIISFILDLLANDFRQFGFISLLIALSNIVFLYLVTMQKTIFLTNRKEVLALVLAIISSLVLLIPVLSLQSSSEYIYFLSSGEDNASHFAMLHRTVVEQGVPYFDGINSGLIGSLNVYPQSIQTFFGYGLWSFIGDESPSSYKLLVAYYAMMVLVCSSIIFIVSLLISRFSSKEFWFTASLLGTASIFISVLLFLAGWGFVSQIAAMTYFLSLVYILHKYKESPQKLSDVWIAGIMTAGIAFTWYLLLLPTFVVAFKFLMRMLSKGVLFLISGLMLFIATLMPIVLNVVNSKGTSALNEAGGVYKYEEFALTIIIALLVLAISGRIINKQNISPVIFNSLVGTGILTLIIAAYQLVTIGHFEYYFYKSLYLLLTIELIILSIVLSHVIKSLLNKTAMKHISLMVLNVAIIMTFCIALAAIKPTYPQVYLNNWFNHTLLPSTLSNATNVFDNKTSKDVLIVSCNTTREYIANRWTGALFLSENRVRNNIETGRFYGVKGEGSWFNYVKDRSGARVSIEPCD